MTPKPTSTAALLAALLALSPVLHAQQTPTLDQILQHLDANLTHYESVVPSFFADEHVLSQIATGVRPPETTTTDSIFRLKRTPTPNHTTSLVESRQIRSVDGKPPATNDIDGPTTLNGAFAGGLAVVSLTQKPCIVYTLQKPKKNQPYLIRFTTVLTPQNTPACLLDEPTKGRATIDPATLQITRLELTTPHHVIIPGNRFTDRFVGERLLTVDYAPIPLGPETFWLPTTITSRDTTGKGTFHPTVWTFQATYRNYHKLEVTTRIVPTAETP